MRTAYHDFFRSEAERAAMKALVAAHSQDGVVDWGAAYRDFLAAEEAKAKAKADAAEAQRAAYIASTTPKFGAMRIAAETAVKERLVDPESARFEWPYGFMLGDWKPLFQKRVEGWVTCGLVNSRNRMGGFAGRAWFAVVVEPGPRPTTKYVEIATGRDLDLTRIACEKTQASLPPPQAGMLQPNQPEDAPPFSIANELAKLAELRDKGVLSEAKFQQQKAKLLDK